MVTMSKSKPKTVTDQLRKAIAESGMTLYRVAKDSQVDHATLHRFMAGQDLRLSTVDKLAAYLGLEMR
jgi:predicted transcriptional regulator